MSPLDPWARAAFILSTLAVALIGLVGPKTLQATASHCEDGAVTQAAKTSDDPTLRAVDNRGQDYFCETRSADGLTVNRTTPSWSTADASVATADEFGGVKGQSPGTAIVSARSGDQFESVTVEVAGEQQPSCVENVQAFIHLEGADFTREREFTNALYLEPGWSRQYSVRVTDIDTGSPAPDCLSDNWNWRSLNESVATVDNYGIAIARALGSALIRVEHAEYPQINTVLGAKVVGNWLNKDKDDSSRDFDVA